MKQYKSPHSTSSTTHMNITWFMFMWWSCCWGLHNYRIMINVDKSPFRYLAIAMTTFCLCYILGSLLYSFAVFVVVNFFFAVVDLTGKPEFLLKYKIQEEKTVSYVCGHPLVSLSTFHLCAYTPGLNPPSLNPEINAKSSTCTPTRYLCTPDIQGSSMHFPSITDHALTK